MLNRLFKGHDILYVFCEKGFAVTHDNVHLNGLSNLINCLLKDPGENIIQRAPLKQVVVSLYRGVPLLSSNMADKHKRL